MAQRSVASAAGAESTRRKVIDFPGVLRPTAKEAKYELVYRRCAGLDIHKKSISACVRIRPRGQQEPEISRAVFGTFTAELEKLRSWLKQHKVKHIAMESTGVYWIPVWNVLEAE